MGWSRGGCGIISRGHPGGQRDARGGGGSGNTGIRAQSCQADLEAPGERCGVQPGGSSPSFLLLCVGNESAESWGELGWNRAWKPGWQPALLAPHPLLQPLRPNSLPEQGAKPGARTAGSCRASRSTAAPSRLLCRALAFPWDLENGKMRCRGWQQWQFLPRLGLGPGGLLAPRSPGSVAGMDGISHHGGGDFLFGA